jgi:hypothetical protein
MQNMFSQEADLHDWQCKLNTFDPVFFQSHFEIWHAADGSGLLRGGHSD